jgi:hypothetical protein
MNALSRVFNATTRRWIYGICIAAVPVLVYFQLIPAESAPVILPLILAIMNVQADPSATVTVYERPDDHMNRDGR